MVAVGQAIGGGSSLHPGTALLPWAAPSRVTASPGGVGRATVEECSGHHAR